MKNPYAQQPDYAFWQKAVVDPGVEAVDPVTNPPFTLSKQDAIATAGSCFAQHIARTLSSSGFNYLVTETAPLTEGAKDEGYGLFTARFGNLYTVRQLLQLFDRAYGLFEPKDVAWKLRRGEGWVDPFRPNIQEGGFDTIEALIADREAHIETVREMFETCDVFIFTLGLTEGWVSKRDGAVFPLAPGVGGIPSDEGSNYEAVNFKVADMIADMSKFLDKLRAVNPDVKVILTVSPVPLIATFEDRHVLVSTIASKSALRVVAEETCNDQKNVTYFPSYEIVTAHFNDNAFEADQRSVRPETVARVMGIFSRHYLTGTTKDVPVQPRVKREKIALSESDKKRMTDIAAVVCDEEEIIKA